METAKDNTNNKLLFKVALMLTAFRGIHPLMTIQGAHIFILVALHEGKSISEVARLSGYRIPSVSRTLQDLGERNRTRGPGLKLIEAVVDPMELRRKNLKLTNKGQALINQFKNIMEV